jgi:hypothetical protein
VFSSRADGLGSTRAWTWPVLIAVLAVASSMSGITNQFAQDDIPIILWHGEAHHLGDLGRAFVEPYWPAPFTRSLYRPLVSLSFKPQWVIGDGAPIVFRMVSYALYGLAAVAFLSLARLRLPLIVAAVSAALYAVHPVHVESVAVAVNQSELWVGLLACLIVVMYVRERERGGPISTRSQLILTGLYLASCLFKESALVIPGFIVAAELLLLPGAEPLRERLGYLRRPVLFMLLVGAAFYYVRTRILLGNLAGTFTAEHLFGLSMGERAIAMVAVIPHWVRLLFWPEHLRADYGPGELVAQTSWGWDHTLGLILLGAALAGMAASWRRAPVIAFGIVWCALGLFPVSNVLLPTGIMLAERTLFLPSVGAMLILGGVGALLYQPAAGRGELILGALSIAILLAGMFRSLTRHPIWHDQFGLWYKTANEDAPRSFRAHEALAEAYFHVGKQGMAEEEYQIALHFAPISMLRPRLSYADKLRLRGACYPAAEHYRIALQVEPRHTPARAALIACLVDLGHYREAMFHARMGLSYGWQLPLYRRMLHTADSALRVTAPPGTVRIDLPKQDSSSASVPMVGDSMK